MKTVDVGAAVEWKARSGLGGWRPGTVARVEDGAATITDRHGDTHQVPLRLVRAPRARGGTSSARTPASLRGARQREGTARAPASRIVRPAPEAIARAVEKKGPWRSPQYLAYIRAMACCVCGAPGPSDPSHHGRRGLGQKTDDYRTIPLCRADHDRFHARGVLGDRSLSETAAFVREVALHLIGGFLKRHAFTPIVFETPECR